MSATRVTCFALFVLWLGALCGTADAKITAGHAYAPHEIIVKFKDPADFQAKSALVAMVGARDLHIFSGIKAEHWQVTTSVKEAVALLERDPRVEYAEPNYQFHLLRVPNERRFREQWGRHNTGQTGGSAGADVGAVEAWDVATGSRQVVIAVLDTGVDYLHPDLAANIWTNPGEIAGNGLDDDGNGYIDDTRGYDFGDHDNDPMDFDSHGTFVAGIIGGVGDNGVGVAGVNWNVSIMPLKILSTVATDTLGYYAAAIAAVEYGTAEGIDVMSNSWGGGPYDPALVAAITNAYNAGIFFVCAVGNVGNNNDVNPMYPANYDIPNVIAVMATDYNDLSVATPNWGWMTSYGATTVDIGAPGSMVMSTTPGGGYYKSSGTSFSTPFVSGALGLLRSRFPTISVDAGKTRLMTIGRDLLPDLTGKCVSGGRLNVFKLIADVDSIPPSAVTDLTTTTAASNWLDVAWTAPGDDGGVGTAHSYEVRWSLAPITSEVDWAGATPVPVDSVPGVSGSAEVMHATGLPAAGTVYLNLRARDEYGNLGGLSNTLAATTLGAAHLGVMPPALDVILPTGGTTTRTMTITNTGQGVLDFSIPEAEYIRPVKAMAAATGSGGPDLYGHTWQDSDAIGGPAYNWIEINTIGTAMPLQPGAVSPFLPIGFPFQFYGTVFNTFTISADGWLSFTDPSFYWNRYPFPATTSAPRNAVAVYWSDLYPGPGGGQIYYYNDGTRLIVEYDHIYHATNGGVFTMQIHLYPDGVIEYHYRDMSTINSDGIIGIQNATGDDGLTVVSNTSYVHNNMAIRLARNTPWVRTGPQSGRLSAGASMVVDVVFEATGLCRSPVNAMLHLVSNDPVTPDAVVPASLTISGPACGLTPSPTSLWFNLGSVDTTGSRVMTLHNGSAVPLNFTIPTPSVATKSALGAGGPDANGYSWKDSDDPQGPVFQWLDIRSTGVLLLGAGANASIGPVTYGFGFDLYGQVFNSCEVSSNGFLSFTSTLPAPVNFALPSASAPPNLIAPFWDDLNLDAVGSGDIYGQIVNGDLVVMYDAVMPTNSLLSGSGPFTFEVILAASGQITMQYLTLTGLANSHTVGIQDANGSRALQLVHNGPYLHDNMAVRIRPLPRWLSVSPASGVVPPGGNLDVTVFFDRTNLAVGRHTGRIDILSDAVGGSPVAVPVALVVGDVSGVGDPVAPLIVSLRQNTPNPFNPATKIAYDLPRAGWVSLKVYDVRGSLVRTLLDESRPAGRYEQIWRGRNETGREVASGVYFYRLQTPEQVLTRRMTLVK